MEQLRPIETAPKDGTFILLFGDSGYTTTPLRCAVGRYYPEYRPLDPWQTHSNDSFKNNGGPPLFWLPLPQALRMPDGELKYESGEFLFCPVTKLMKGPPLDLDL